MISTFYIQETEKLKNRLSARKITESKKKGYLTLKINLKLFKNISSGKLTQGSKSKFHNARDTL